MQGLEELYIVALVYTVAVLLLCAGFYFAHPVDTVRQIAKVAGSAFAIMTDASKDDLTKEKEVQRCALMMLKQAVQLMVKLLVILSVTVFPVWLAAVLGWTDTQTFTTFALRVDVLLVTTAAILVPVIAMRKLRKPGP